MNPNANYEDLLYNIVAPRLAPIGFLRRNEAFYVTEHSNIGIIDFQRSTSSDNDFVRFTLNLGIISRRLRQFFAFAEAQTIDLPILAKENVAPPIEASHWRRRIGSLLPSQQDLWWTFESDTDIRAVQQVVLTLLLDVAVPTIKLYIRDESLRDTCFAERSLRFLNLCYLSVLLKEIGSAEKLAPTLLKLRQVTEGTPKATAAEAHIQRISGGNHE